MFYLFFEIIILIVVVKQRTEEKLDESSLDRIFFGNWRGLNKYN